MLIKLSSASQEKFVKNFTYEVRGSQLKKCRAMAGRISNGMCARPENHRPVAAWLQPAAKPVEIDWLKAGDEFYLAPAFNAHDGRPQGLRFPGRPPVYRRAVAGMASC
jgi:hypothetical protein